MGGFEQSRNIVKCETSQIAIVCYAKVIATDRK